MVGIGETLRTGRAVVAAVVLIVCGWHAPALSGDSARTSVMVPQTARSAGVVMLEVSVRATGRSAGHLGGVVRLSGTEVGRFSLTGGGAQRYQFDVARAVKSLAGGSADIEVQLIDRDGGPMASGAGVSIGSARIVMR